MIHGVKVEFNIKYACDNCTHFLVRKNHKGLHVEMKDVRAD